MPSTLKLFTNLALGLGLLALGITIGVLVEKDRCARERFEEGKRRFEESQAYLLQEMRRQDAILDGLKIDPGRQETDTIGEIRALLIKRGCLDGEVRR